MERCAHGNGDDALGAESLGDLAGARNCSRGAGNHDLTRAVVVRRRTNLALRGLTAGLFDLVVVESENDLHCSDANRHGLLHEGPARAHEANGVCHVENACGHER